MEENGREELRERIAERLGSCDSDALSRVSELLDLSEERGAEKPVLFSEGISRRQFLAGVTAGGAALVSTNLATGLVAGSLGTKAGQAVARLESEAELIKLRGLLGLYESLEQVGIDALLSTGVALLSASIEGLETGITALEKGVGLVDAGVTAFEGSFPFIRRGLAVVENLFTRLENRVTRLQELMADVQEIVSPLSDAVGSFFSSLVERIPGVGPSIVDALDRISELVGSLPDAIGEVRSRLIEPLSEDWFTDDEESGLKGRLLNPLQEELLGPLESFLAGLADTIDDWQEELINPMEWALAERDTICGQIADYREREGMA
ncbi:MAG TPA: hypothetical protein VMW58_07625 [Anaerolineae bacterium]|nr:hypothetical protein [Anaerolineae bacterium]